MPSSARLNGHVDIGKIGGRKDGKGGQRNQRNDALAPEDRVIFESPANYSSTFIVEKK